MSNAATITKHRIAGSVQIPTDLLTDTVTTNTSALRELCQRWDRPLLSLLSVAYDTQHTFKRLFKLASRANWTLFATWDHFGIAAMKSETAMARKVQAYFLDSGVRVVADAIAEQETGLSVHQLEAFAQRVEQRFDAMEQRLTVPTSHDLIDQRVLAARIANYERLTRAGQIDNIRVGSHNISLA
jgi:hypothetical protein